MVNGADVKVPHARLVAGQSAIWAIERGENMYIESIAAEPKQPHDKGQRHSAQWSPPTRASSPGESPASSRAFTRRAH
jgi:hypothetical protein